MVKNLSADCYANVHGKQFLAKNYRVEDGDTVFGLWAKYRSQTTVGAIMDANGIAGDGLKTDKVIKIPLVL